jgi:hypothetical protein
MRAISAKAVASMTRNLEHVPHTPVMHGPMPRATARWLAARGLRPPAERWKVTIALDIADPRVVSGPDLDTRLHIMIDSVEWSVFFCHRSGTSWIRVADVPRVHERDDFGLLSHVTELRGIGAFVQWLERRFHLQFRRPHAAIHTNLVDAQQKILLWIVAAL